MGWADDARDELWRMLLSPWAILLALSLVALPAYGAASLLLGVDDPGPPTVELAVQTIGSMSSFAFTATVLVGIVASGAWSSAASVRGALVGRAGAMLAILAGAWLVPVLLVASSRAGAFAAYPALLMFGILALEALAWVALLTLVAEMSVRAPGVGAIALWLVLAVLVEYATFYVQFALFARDPIAFAGWQTAIGFVSPSNASEALRGATFPILNFDRVVGRAEPMSPWPFLGAALAWILVPALVALRGDARPRETPDAVPPGS